LKSQVLKGKVDFTVDPWPRVSPAARDCVAQLLTVDAAKRPTAQQILQVTAWKGWGACRLICTKGWGAYCFSWRGGVVLRMYL
jgi:hypothetical protein